MINRRGFLAGLTGLVAAPAVIRTIDLMPVKTVKSLYGIKSRIYVEEIDTTDVISIDLGNKFLLTGQLKLSGNGIWMASGDLKIHKLPSLKVIEDARQSSFKDHSQKLDAKLRARLERPERIA